MNSMNNRVDYGFYGYRGFPRHHHRHSGGGVSIGVRL